MSSLKDKFKKETIKDLQRALGIENLMDVPKLEKVVVNMGVKDALSDKKNIDKASLVLSAITGQKPKVTAARKAISGFKLRKGDKIGLMTTLRSKRMYDFFERLVTVVLPRLRNFRGIEKKSFDRHGNYTLGFREATVFPEIDPGKVDLPAGGGSLEITIVVAAKDDKEGFELLKAMGMPFQK